MSDPFFDMVQCLERVSYECRIHEYQQSKARRQEEIRHRKQYEELKDCTFQPEINRRRPARSSSCAHVRGVASHLDKQVQARKKVEAEERRKAEVFILNPKAPKAKYTVAQPFRLQGESRVRCLLPVQVGGSSALHDKLCPRNIKVCDVLALRVNGIGAEVRPQGEARKDHSWAATSVCAACNTALCFLVLPVLLGQVCQTRLVQPLSQTTLVVFNP
jgi:hypothetical protein